MICLVNSVNERDYYLLNSWPSLVPGRSFLEVLAFRKRLEVSSNNRSVMPLDVLGRARATLTEQMSLTLFVREDRAILKLRRGWNRPL